MATLLNISEAASLALHTMVLLAAEDGEVTSTHRIAERLKGSDAHLSKVLQRLHRVGLVRSVRGPKGGFVLARASREIRLLEVFEAIDGPLTAHDCLFDERICDGSACVLGDCLKTLSKRLRAHLSKTRLADLADLFKAGTAS